MLYTIAVVLLVMWLLGLVTSYTMGGFIHILLVVAIVMVLVNLITGRLEQSPALDRARSRHHAQRDQYATVPARARI
jgi:hypothetical protein